MSVSREEEVDLLVPFKWQNHSTSDRKCTSLHFSNKKWNNFTFLHGTQNGDKTVLVLFDTQSIIPGDCE